MKKRTRQLDDSREILLPKTINGKQVWTTAGDLAPLDPGEKSELSSNIKGNAHKSNILKLAQAVLTNASLFIHDTFAKLNPQLVEELNTAFDSEALFVAGHKFDSWVRREGLNWKLDGLTTVITKRGKVLAEMTAKVDERFAREVGRQVRMMVREAQAERN